MSFPLVLGTNTITESSFLGTGYVSAIPDLAEKMASYFTLPPWGASVSSLAISAGTKNFTLNNEAFLHVGQNVRLFNSLTTYMEGTVTSYTRSTGAMSVSVGLVAGAGTFSVWSIVPTGFYATPNPLSVFRGGSPSLSLSKLKQSLGGFSRECFMQPVETHFMEPYSASSPYPFYSELEGAGVISSEGNYSAPISGNYAGIWTMSCTAVGDSAFLSYGKLGFVYLGEGGDLLYRARVLTPSFSSGETLVCRLGMMNGSSVGTDQFQSLGFGFECLHNATTGQMDWYAVVHDGTQKFSSLIATSASEAPIELCARFCSSDKSVRVGNSLEAVRSSHLTGEQYLKVSLSAFFAKLEASSTSLKRATNMKPFFYVEKASGTASKRLSLDYLSVTRQVSRSF